MPIRSLILGLLGPMLLLTACVGPTLPTPGPDFKGFGFTGDPAANTLTPYVPSSLRNQTATAAAVARVLVNGVDLEMAAFAFTYRPDNTLEITASFTNITSGFAFLQPFSFTPDPALTSNVVTSTEPMVTDADLGGDGSLRPGETTTELVFVVEHRGRAFTYFINAEADVEEVVAEADLAITKTDDVDPVVAGGALAYTLTVSNAGPDTAENVVVTDTLPAGVTFGSSSGCAQDPTGVPTCSLGSVAAGASVQVTVAVFVDAGTSGVITNRASVASDTGDPNPGNNAATQDTTVDPVPPTTADLAISKVDDVDPNIPGGTIGYTITVDNAGPLDATDVVVTDTLPAGVTFVASSGCAEDPNGAPTCSLGTIPAGGSAQVTIEVTIDAGTSGTLTNQAEVASATDDPDAGNNAVAEDTVVVTTPLAPTAVDDTVAGTSLPGDDFHTPLDTPLTTVDGSSQDLDGNDTLGAPPASVVGFGGGDLGGAVTDNAAGSTVGCGGACTLTVNADGTITFMPDTGFTGLFSFDYRLENLAGFDDASVTLAVGARPQAGADGFDAIGNVGITAAAVAGVLANDAGDQLVVTVFDAASGNGGSVSVAADGSFSYESPPGFEGADTFGYTMGNGFGSDTATATIDVAGVIWFVDNSQVVQGDGRLNNPFNSLGGSGYATAAADPGDAVFLHAGSGDYGDGVVLLNDQVLIGQGATASVAAIAGLTVPAVSNALPATGGTSPIIANAAGDGIGLATDNTVRGLDIGDTSGTGMVGTEVGSLTVREVGIGGSGGGVDLGSTTGAAIDVVLDSLSASSSSDEGVRLDNVSGSFTITDTSGVIATTGVPAVDIDGAPLAIGMTFESISVGGSANGILVRDTTGSFAVTGTGTTNGSGGVVSSIAERGASFIASENIALGNMTFSNASTANGSSCTNLDNAGCNAAIHLQGSSGIVLTNVDISGSVQQGINGLDVTDFSLANSTVGQCGDQVDEGCLRMVNLAGTAAITDSDLSFPADRVARIDNADATLDLTISGSTFRDTQSSGLGADGLEVVSTGSSSTTIAITDSSFLRNRTNGLQVIAADTAVVSVDATGSTFDRDAGIGIGMDLAADDAATLSFNVIGNPLITGNGGSAINVFADGSATVQGRINDNPAIQAGGATSSGFGIRVTANTNADVTVEIANNTISDIGFDAGIEILSRLGTTGRADATITNNTVTVDVVNSLYDIWTQVADGNTVCANVTDNSASGNAIAAFRARTVNAASTLILQGTGATATDVWNDNGNTPLDDVSSSHNGTLTLGGTCTTVTHPTP